MVWGSWGLSALFTILFVTTDLFISSIYRYNWGYYPAYNGIAILFLLYFCAPLCFALYMYIKRYKVVNPKTFHFYRVRNFMVAFAVAYLASADFLAKLGIPVYPFGYQAILVFCLISARTIIRYHLVDITAGVAAEQVLKTMQDALVVINKKGSISLVNEAARKLFHLPNQKAIDRSIRQFFPDKAFAAMIESIIVKGKINNNRVTYTMPYTIPDQGDTYVLQVSASTLASRSGRTLAYIFIFDDITSRKQAEERLQKSKKD